MFRLQLAEPDTQRGKMVLYIIYYINNTITATTATIPTHSNKFLDLIVVERHILKDLGFGLYSVMHHPHQYILYFIKVTTTATTTNAATTAFLVMHLIFALAIRWQSGARSALLELSE